MLVLCLGEPQAGARGVTQRPLFPKYEMREEDLESKSWRFHLSLPALRMWYNRQRSVRSRLLAVSLLVHVSIRLRPTYALCDDVQVVHGNILDEVLQRPHLPRRSWLGAKVFLTGPSVGV